LIIFGNVVYCNGEVERHNMSKKVKSEEERLKEISEDAFCSWSWASKYLKGRFEMGEEAISKSAEYSYSYARDIIKGRFELGEEVISKDADFAFLYARDVLKGRFELGERVNGKDAYFKRRYEEDVLGCSFEELVVRRVVRNSIMELEL